MKRLVIPFILLILLALQGVAVEIAVSFTSMQDVYIIAHWVFVFLVCILMFFDSDNSYYAIGYSVLFGLLIDIVYTDMLGIYMLSYGLAILIVQGIKKAFHANLYSTTLMLVTGLVIADSLIHSIYYMMGIIELPFIDYLWVRLVPTILANIIFLMIIYPFIYKQFPKWNKEFQERS